MWSGERGRGLKGAADRDGWDFGWVGEVEGVTGHEVTEVAGGRG